MTATLFDLHGLVTIEVRGDARDVATVTSQLGPAANPAQASPKGADLVVSFVDHLDTGPLTRLGKADFGYSSDAFVVLRGKHKAPIRVAIPFDELDGLATVTVQRGAPAVPYLIALVNLLVARNGGVAVHASAVELGGRGALITGWSKGGKTETLLALLGAGARYVGDEWVYVSPDGNRLGGVAEPIRVWDWYLPQIGPMAAAVRRGERARLATLRAASRANEVLTRGAVPRPIAKLARRSHHLLESQRHVDVRPTELAHHEAGTNHTSFDLLIHTVSAETKATTIEPADAADVAARIAASLRAERAPLAEVYQAYRYAFPERHSPLIDRVDSCEASRLMTLFHAKRCYELRHPYPPDLSSLRTAVAPLFGEAR